MMASIVEEYTVRIERDEATGRVLMESHHAGGKLHRLGEPALRVFDQPTGALVAEEWYQHGVQCREHGPAVTHIDPQTGVIHFQLWITKHGLHRTGGLPAKISRDVQTGIVVFEDYYEYGKQHNSHGPAYIHRDDRSGVVVEEEWYLHGLLTREGGLPARIERDEDSHVVVFEEYWVDGRPFRADGPCRLDFDPVSGALTHQDLQEVSTAKGNRPSQAAAKPDWQP